MDSFAAFMKNHPLLINLVLPDDQADAIQTKDFVDFLVVGKSKQVGLEKREELGAPYSIAAVASQYLKSLA
jgi:hypothetical protein